MSKEVIETKEVETAGKLRIYISLAQRQSHANWRAKRGKLITDLSKIMTDHLQI